MNRRVFVSSAIAGVLPACAALATTTVTPLDGRLAIIVGDHPGLDRPGGFLRIRPAGSDSLLYVLAQPDGAFTVVSPICKHRGCNVDITGSILECPCHGSRYDRSGAVLRGPTQAPLDRYRSNLSDGVLTITLEARA